MDFETRLAELFIELPEVPKTAEGVSPFVLADKFCWVGMQLPLQAGKIPFKGRLGIEITLDQGKLAARYALLVALSALRLALGSLNKIKQFVQLTGYVASGGDFKEQSQVLENASKLLVDIFGNAGRHTRQAVGVNSLPQNACVGIALVVTVK